MTETNLPAATHVLFRTHSGFKRGWLGKRFQISNGRNEIPADIYKALKNNELFQSQISQKTYRVVRTESTPEKTVIMSNIRYPVEHRAPTLFMAPGEVAWVTVDEFKSMLSQSPDRERLCSSCFGLCGKGPDGEIEFLGWVDSGGNKAQPAFDIKEMLQGVI